jgi:hypothetical protein
VHKHHAVRIHGHVTDIQKRPNSAYATYAGKDDVTGDIFS